MMQSRRLNLMCLSIVITFCIIISFYQYYYVLKRSSSAILFPSTITRNEKFRILSNQYSSAWFQKNCFKIKSSDINTVDYLPQYLYKARSSKKHICQDFALKFDALFRVEEIYGSLKLSSVYLKKINEYFNKDPTLVARIKNQRIIKIYNRHSHEEMLYNYMRSRRPQTKSQQSAET